MSRSIIVVIIPVLVERNELQHDAARAEGNAGDVAHDVDLASRVFPETQYRQVRRIAGRDMEFADRPQALAAANRR